MLLRGSLSRHAPVGGLRLGRRDVRVWGKRGRRHWVIGIGHVGSVQVLGIVNILLAHSLDAVGVVLDGRRVVSLAFPSMIEVGIQGWQCESRLARRQRSGLVLLTGHDNDWQNARVLGYYVVGLAMKSRKKP